MIPSIKPYAELCRNDIPPISTPYKVITALAIAALAAVGVALIATGLCFPAGVACLALIALPLSRLIMKAYINRQQRFCHDINSLQNISHGTVYAKALVPIRQEVPALPLERASLLAGYIALCTSTFYADLLRKGTTPISAQTAAASLGEGATQAIISLLIENPDLSPEKALAIINQFFPNEL